MLVTKRINFESIRPAGPITAMMIAAAVVLSWASCPAQSVTADPDKIFQKLDRDKSGHLESSELQSEPATQAAPAPNSPAAQQSLLLYRRLLRKADEDKDGKLSREEFRQGLLVDRPERLLPEKDSSRLPGADSVEYVLLSMDRDANGTIVASEVPDRFAELFDEILEKFDRNGDKKLTSIELGRAGGQLNRLAGRFVLRERINVRRELPKLKARSDQSADRFSKSANGMQMMRDPQMAQQAFAQLDANGDGLLVKDELPEGVGGPMQRMFRFADRNRDQALSEQEFRAALERARRFQMQD